MSRSEPTPPRTLISTGPEQTRRLGFALGQLLEPGDVVGLTGELGAGKTCLVGGVAEGAGVASDVYVSSPTFTLINEYPGRVDLAHIDFYRLAREEDLVEICVDEYYGGSHACLVEWFDRFPGAAPPEYLEVVLLVTGVTGRELRLQPRGERPQRLAVRWVEVCTENA